MRPTSMLYRNFLAMEVEEAIRSQPVDGVALLGGCDKTTPGLIMGAASAECSGDFRAGRRDAARPLAQPNSRHGIQRVGGGGGPPRGQAYRGASGAPPTRHRSARTGTCNTMGTASTMTTLVDVMGLCLPGASTIPAVDAEHASMASEAGRRIVEMVWEDLKPRDIVTPASLRNAVVADMAISGSTNSLIHLIAMARRFDLDFELDDFVGASEISAGGLQFDARRKISDGGFSFRRRHTGATQHHCRAYRSRGAVLHGRNAARGDCGRGRLDDDVIRPIDKPVYPGGALVVLKGTLAPRGAVLKRSAATEALLQHTGPAVVFPGLART